MTEETPIRDRETLEEKCRALVEEWEEQSQSRGGSMAEKAAMGYCAEKLKAVLGDGE